MCVCVCVWCAGGGVEGGVKGWRGEGGYRHLGKLQALVYDILPSTTAVFSYAIGF